MDDRQTDSTGDNDINMQVALSDVDGDVDLLIESCQTDERRAIITHFETASSETAPLTKLVDLIRSVHSEYSRNEIRATLHHNHLPRLAEAGLIEYEPERSRVVYHGNPLARQVVEACRSQ